MAKNIILYNLKDTVTDEDYAKWCEEYKGPLLLSLDSSKSFALVKMLGGIKGDGRKGSPPEETPSPYRYIGVLDITSLEGWKKDTETRKFKEEFFPRWLSDWVSDFYVLVGEEVFERRRG